MVQLRAAEGITGFKADKASKLNGSLSARKDIITSE